MAASSPDQKVCNGLGGPTMQHCQRLFAVVRDRGAGEWLDGTQHDLAARVHHCR
jgi:hypothetical protein